MGWPQFIQERWISLSKKKFSSLPEWCCVWKMTDIWAVLTSFASRINIFVDSRLRSHHVCPGNNLSSTDNFFLISENGDCFLNCRSCPNCNWECFYPVNIVLLVFNTGRQFGWIGTVNFRLKYSDKRSWEAKQLFLGFSTSKTRKKKLMYYFAWLRNVMHANDPGTFKIRYLQEENIVYSFWRYSTNAKSN